MRFSLKCKDTLDPYFSTLAWFSNDMYTCSKKEWCILICRCIFSCNVPSVKALYVITWFVRLSINRILKQQKVSIWNFREIFVMMVRYKSFFVSFPGAQFEILGTRKIYFWGPKHTFFIHIPIDLHTFAWF